MLLIHMSQVREYFPVVPGKLLTNPFLIYDSWGTSAGRGILIDFHMPPALNPSTPLKQSAHVFNPTRDIPGFMKILHLIKKPSTNTPHVPLQTPLCNSHPLAFYTLLTSLFGFYPVVGGQ